MASKPKVLLQTYEHTASIANISISIQLDILLLLTSNITKNYEYTNLYGLWEIP